MFRPKLLRRHRLLLSGFLLLISILFPFQANVVRAGVNVTDCSGGACKAWNQWNGGSIGNWARIGLAFNVCDLGCNFVEKGLWAKWSGDSNYIALIEQLSTYGSSWYAWARYKTGSGLTYYYMDKVDTNDRAFTADFTITKGNTVQGTQLVTIASQGPSRYYRQIDTGVLQDVWDIIETGYRVSSGSGGHAEVFDYQSINNQWRCGCDSNWYYQSSDGYMYNQASDWLGQGWPTPPHLSSYGGIYDANCNCP